MIGGGEGAIERAYITRECREIESMKRLARAQEVAHLEIERKLLRAIQDLDDANSAHLEEEFLLKANHSPHLLGSAVCHNLRDILRKGHPPQTILRYILEILPLFSFKVSDSSFHQIENFEPT
jgi:hypothetical protein